MHPSTRVAALALWAATGLTGQTPGEPDPSPLEALLRIPVIAASKREQLPIESPQAIEVITAEQIQASGAFRLAEVLALATSVQVVDQDGDRAVLVMRGVNPNGNPRTLQILVDGVAMFNLVGAPVDINAIPVPLAAIERIEILRGPASALYGANAQMGVVSILTRRGASRLQGGLRAGAGAVGLFRSEAMVQAGGPGVAFLAAAAQQNNRDEGIRLPGLGTGIQQSVPNGSKARQAFLKATVDLPGDGSLWASLGSARSDQADLMPSRPDTGELVARLSNIASDRLAMQVGWRQPWRANLSTEFRASEKVFRTVVGPLVGMGTPLSQMIVQATLVQDPAMASRHDLYRDRVRTLQGQANWDPSGDLHLVAGADASWISTGTSLIVGLTGPHQLTATGVFLSADGALGPVVLSGGLRLANETLGGSLLSPRLSAVWRLDDDTALRAGWFTATRSPMVQERFMTTQGSPLVPINYSANPDVRSERAQSYELGFRHQGKAWSVDLSFYRTGLDRLITGLGKGTVSNGYADVFFGNSIEPVVARGLELTLLGSWVPGLDLGVTASLQRYRDPVDAVVPAMERSPRLLGSVWGKWTSGGLSAFAALRGWGGYPVAEISRTTEQDRLPTRIQAQAHVSWASGSGWRIGVYGFNALRSHQPIGVVSLTAINVAHTLRRELGVQTAWTF